MFGLGASEIVVILALILIVFGPQKMPELARQLARLMGDLRRAADDVKQNFDDATREPPPSYEAQALSATSTESYHSGPVPEGQTVGTPLPPDVAPPLTVASPQEHHEEQNPLAGTEPAPGRRKPVAAARESAAAAQEPVESPKVNSEEPTPEPNTRAPNGRPS